MDRRTACRDHLAHCLERCNAPAPDRSGKVRDLYERDGELWMVVTDRVSAFDVVLGTIPLKGALLAEQAAFWLSKAADIMPTHLLDQPDPQILRCRRAEPLAVELVVRGHVAGSLAREPASTRGQAYGLRLDPGLKPFDPLDEPIVTPTTKAEQGDHDQPISAEDLVASGVLSSAQWEEAREKALALYAMGASFAREQGLILVDTKYEVGLLDGQLALIDEVHTADSSRYWEAEEHENTIADGGYSDGASPRMLDKERLRRWLLDQGFSGSGPAPDLTEDVRVDLALHYWELTERLLGRPFAPPAEPASTRVERALAAGLG